MCKYVLYGRFGLCVGLKLNLIISIKGQRVAGVREEDGQGGGLTPAISPRHAASLSGSVAAAFM